MLKAKVKIEEDTCPMCGSTVLSYEDIHRHRGQIEQDATCYDCGFSFQQWYELIFDGMTTTDPEDGRSHVNIVN